jgi:broad specificity phosphatase PhoE
MTTIFLIRHGLTDDVGRRLSGTARGVHLNAAGRQQAEQLAHRLTPVPLDAVVASPLERALETAAPIAESHGLVVESAEAIGEFGCGVWTGLEITSLADDEAWQRFNTMRSLTPAPSGELMLDVQRRAVGTLLDLRGRIPDGTVAVVSHGDVIRAALLFFLGMPLDFVHRLEVSPARVSILQIDSGAPRVLQINGETAL